MVSNFTTLRENGYMDLIIPIIPHDAKLSGQSQVSEKDRGKVPGRLNFNGHWTGFPAWQMHKTTPEDLSTWAKWRCGIGFRTGDIIGLDIDVTDAALADSITSLIIRLAGQTAVRTGNAPKRLLMYGCTEPVRKRKVRFELPDGTQHAVELLGQGQQFVVHGIHPKTQMPYRWEPKGGPLGFHRDKIIKFSVEVLDRLWDSILKHIRDAGGIIIDESHSKTVGQKKSLNDPTLVGDVETLAAALEVLPNKFDYEGWIRMCAAIKAAFGGDENNYQHFEKWCLKYAGNEPVDIRKRWDSIRTSELGADYVLEQARAHGFSTASNEFEAVATPEELDIFDEGVGVDKSRQQAVEEMFKRYIWVESMTRFFDREERILLNREQFNVRHANIGNPASSKTCAANVYVRDMARRTVANDVTYRPGQELFVNEASGPCINLYKPPVLKLPEIVNDSDVSPWLDLVKYVIPDDKARATVMDWMAFTVQHPGAKINWALLIGSTAQGVGKDMMFMPVIKGVGESNARYVGPADLASGYTEWAANTKLVIVEEMHSFERKETMNKLKAYITNPPAMVRVNAKYIPQYQVPNIANYLFFTNLPNALGLEREDRRFFVYWSPAKRADSSFYEGIIKWYAAGGENAIIRWLLQRDVRMFNNGGAAPWTEHKEEMRRAGQGVIEEWVESCIEDHVAPFHTDLVCLAEIMLNLPSRIERQKPSYQRIATAMKSVGAYCFDRLWLGREIPNTGINKGRIYAVRRPDLYANFTVEKLIHNFWKQREEKAPEKDIFSTVEK